MNIAQRLLVSVLLGLSLNAQAQIDEETRQRGIDYVGGLRPPPRYEVPPPPEVVLEGTMKKLAEGGAIYLGYRDDVVPLSFHSHENRPAGFVWDLCAKVVEAAAKQLGLPQVTVVPVPVTLNTRDLYLSTGVIDLECGATTNTLTRQRTMAFGLTTYVSGTRLLTRKDSRIAVVADLANRAVVSVTGTQAERYARTSVALRGANVRYLQARDAAEAVRMLEEGKADAIVGDEITLAVARSTLPKERAEMLVMPNDALAIEPLGIMLRKADTQLKKLLDETLLEAMRNGEFEKLYQRWFQAPIGPEGRNLNLPMSDMLRNLMQAPNDKGI